MEQIQTNAARLTGEMGTTPADAASSGVSLIDERFEHDSCGVGFVATISGEASHSILEQALVALSRLAHRGATAADGKSSDGVGLMTVVPRSLLLASTGVELAAERLLGVGVLFIPKDETGAEAVVERCLASHDLEVLCWRDVPVATDALGSIALSAMPKIRQVLVADTLGKDALSPRDPESMEKRLYLARKQFERTHEDGGVTGYICSLSTQTIVYKAMCSGTLLPEFYPDLKAAEYVTAVHDFSSALCDEYGAYVGSCAAGADAGA